MTCIGTLMVFPLGVKRQLFSGNSENKNKSNKDFQNTDSVGKLMIFNYLLLYNITIFLLRIIFIKQLIYNLFVMYYVL